MTVHSFQTEVVSRGARMLRTALGPAIASWLEDASVVEVMLNPDGRLWIDRLSTGLVETEERLAPAEGERIVRLVAHHVGAEVHPASPRVSAELPETGERFEGLLPPVVAAPTFAIRKPAVAVFTLDDYAAAGIMAMTQADVLRQAVADRRNILVAGGTSTGKTTLANALLVEVAKTADRVVLIEDIPAGNLLPFVPAHSGRLWATYKVDQGILSGFSAGAGIYAASGQYVDAANQWATGGYYTIDAKVGYDNERVRAALSVKNLTDNRYFVPYQWLGGQVAPGSPLMVYGQFALKW